MTYRLEFTEAAAEEIARLPPRERRTMLRRLERVAADPQNAAGVEKLRGRDGYRVRTGVWRALYALDHAERTMTVFRVAHRREVYR